HEQLVAEPDDLDEVDDEPHDPGREPRKRDAPDVRDRGVAPDRGERARIAVAEGARRLAPRETGDVVRGRYRLLDRDWSHHRPPPPRGAAGTRRAAGRPPRAAGCGRL